MAQSTTDYAKFKTLDGNRTVAKGHARNLAKAIALNPEMLAARPILVNQDLEVIDGQHRLEAAKQLGVPIHYEVVKGLNVESAVKLNQLQRNWTAMDYAKSYADQGRDAYKRFMEIKGLYPSLEIGTVISYMSGRQPSGNMSKWFASGKFLPIAPNPIIEQQLDLVLDLDAVMPGLKRPRAAYAVRRIVQSESYDHDRMLMKLTKYGDTQYKHFLGTPDILRNLEDIYNFNERGEHVRLF